MHRRGFRDMDTNQMAKASLDQVGSGSQFGFAKALRDTVFGAVVFVDRAEQVTGLAGEASRIFELSEGPKLPFSLSMLPPELQRLARAVLKSGQLTPEERFEWPRAEGMFLVYASAAPINWDSTSRGVAI